MGGSEGEGSSSALWHKLHHVQRQPEPAPPPRPRDGQQQQQRLLGRLVGRGLVLELAVLVSAACDRNHCDVAVALRAARRQDPG
eukprot:9988938-Lingulodinium_polyedra.AAC.1